MGGLKGKFENLLKQLSVLSDGKKLKENIKYNGSVTIGGTYMYNRFDNTGQPPWNAWLESTHVLTVFQLPFVVHTNVSRELIESNNKLAFITFSVDVNSFKQTLQDRVLKELQAEKDNFLNVDGLKETGKKLGNEIKDEVVESGKGIVSNTIENNTKDQRIQLDSMKRLVTSPQYLNQIKSLTDSMTQYRNKYMKTPQDSMRLSELDSTRNLLLTARETYNTLYNSVQQQGEQYTTGKDNIEKQVSDVASPEGLISYLKTNKKLAPIVNFLLNIKSLQIGSCNVNYSPLTIQNLSVNGINFEYGSDYLYLGITAGQTFTRNLSFFNMFRREGDSRNLVAAKIGMGRDNKTNFRVSMIRIADSGKTPGSEVGSAAFKKSNYILALSYRQNIGKQFYAESEIARSLLTDKQKGELGKGIKQNRDANVGFSNTAVNVLLAADLSKQGTVIGNRFRYIPLNYISLSNPGLRNNIFGNEFSLKQSLYKIKLNFEGAFKYEHYMATNNAANAFNTYSGTFRIKYNTKWVSLNLIYSNVFRAIDNTEFNNNTSFHMLSATASNVLGKRKVKFLNTVNYTFIVTKTGSVMSANHALMLNQIVAVGNKAKVGAQIVYNTPKLFTSNYSMLKGGLNADIAVAKPVNILLGGAVSSTSMAKLNYSYTTAIRLNGGKYGSFDVRCDGYVNGMGASKEFNNRLVVTSAYTYSW